MELCLNFPISLHVLHRDKFTFPSRLPPLQNVLLAPDQPNKIGFYAILNVNTFGIVIGPRAKSIYEEKETERAWKFARAMSNFFFQYKSCTNSTITEFKSKWSYASTSPYPSMYCTATNLLFPLVYRLFKMFYSPLINRIKLVFMQYLTLTHSAL